MSMQFLAAKKASINARRLLDGLVKGLKVPGASLLVLSEGEELIFHAAGWSDLETRSPIRRNTLFRIYSMTKPVVAAGLMALVDDGRLTLESDISDFICEFRQTRVIGVDQPQSRISVRQLLTHTAGLTYWFQRREAVAQRFDQELGAGADERWRFDPQLGGLEALVTKMAGLPLVDVPGKRWHYGMGFEVAGLLIQRVSGQPLDTFLRQRLFAPLGMMDTGFAVPACASERLASLYCADPQGSLKLIEGGSASPLLGNISGLSGGGGLVSTIDDYARFAEMIRLDGKVSGQQILSPEAVSAMVTNQLSIEQLSELPELANFGLGGIGSNLGFGLGGAVIDHSDSNGQNGYQEYCWGGAASTTFWIDRTNDVTVIFMTQLTPPSTQMLRDRLRSALYSNPI